MRKVRGSFGLVLLVLAAAAPLGAQEAVSEEVRRVHALRAQAMQAVEDMRAARLADAQPIDMYSPLYSVASDDETEIYLVNAIASPVQVELTAINTDGQVLPLGRYKLEVTRHLTIPLREAIRPAGEHFHRGSLRLSLIGDSYTVQAWSVIRRGHQLAEFQFQTGYKAPRNEMAALWNSHAAGGARPVFHLVNTGSAPLTFRVEVEGRKSFGDSGPAPTEALQAALERSGRLEPGQSRSVSPDLAVGIVRIEHDGHRGDLRVAGLLEGPDHVSLVPVVAREAWESTQVHEAIRVSWDPEVEGSAVLGLYNVNDHRVLATVEAFDSLTGNRLLRTVRRIEPGRPVSVDAGARLAAMLGKGPARELRLRVTADHPGLLVHGKSRQADGSVDDVTILRPEDAHASGNYPMPSLEEHEVFLTLLNVGEDPTRVVAQFYWDGGTYSYGPVEIPANASYRLAVDDVVREAEPDMLGQTLDPEHRHGFLKWSARGGSNAIVGRTEVRPRGGSDTFGFNCNQCCGEIPWGGVIPESTDFFVGATPSFEAAYWISTCNGTMGPYSAWPTSYSTPWPFSWNGLTVGASSSAKEHTTFFGSEQGAMEGGICIYQDMNISGTGNPNSCKTLLRKGHNPLESWSVTATCVSQVAGESGKCAKCNACCNQILAWKQCTKTGLLTANSEHQACLANCATDVC